MEQDILLHKINIFRTTHTLHVRIIGRFYRKEVGGRRKEEGRKKEGRRRNKEDKEERVKNKE